MPVSMYNRVEPSVLTNEEGVQCFEHTFAIKNVLELVISGTNLTDRYNRWVKSNSSQKPKSIEKHPRSDLETTYTAPRNQTEQTIEKIYSDLLGIEKVGIHDDFFEMGGHSLLAIDLKEQLRDSYSIDIDLYFTYELSTIQKLSRYIDLFTNLAATTDSAAAVVNDLVIQLRDDSSDLPFSDIFTKLLEKIESLSIQGK